MTKTLKFIIPIAIMGSLLSCTDLEPTSSAAPVVPASQVATPKPTNHSLDASVVCCFCGMLDR